MTFAEELQRAEALLEAPFLAEGSTESAITAVKRVLASICEESAAPDRVRS
jgi:hypothetical protein